MRLSEIGPCGWFLIVLSSIELSSQIITPPMIDWAAVRSWLQGDSEMEYKASHATSAPTSTACPSSEKKLVSLTVIDCANRTLIQLPENAQYTTLSYTWGSTSIACNEEWGIDAALRNLPYTIEDSVSVCLNLGQKYLWVDGYCVPQGDAAERHSQIQKMDQIYAASALTIVASVGEGPDNGLPGVRALRPELPRFSIQ